MAEVSRRARLREQVMAPRQAPAAAGTGAMLRAIGGGRSGRPEAPERPAEAQQRPQAAPRRLGRSVQRRRKPDVGRPLAFARRANSVGGPCPRRPSISQAKERSPAKREEAIRRRGGAPGRMFQLKPQWEMRPGRCGSGKASPARSAGSLCDAACVQVEHRVRVGIKPAATTSPGGGRHARVCGWWWGLQGA